MPLIHSKSFTVKSNTANTIGRDVNNNDNYHTDNTINPFVNDSLNKITLLQIIQVKCLSFVNNVFTVVWIRVKFILN